MHKVKTQRSGKLFVKNMLIFKFFYRVIIKNYKLKKLLNKFPEISGKIGINFRKFPEIFRGKFPEISELTTLVVYGLLAVRCLRIRNSKSTHQPPAADHVTPAHAQMLWCKLFLSFPPPSERNRLGVAAVAVGQSHVCRRQGVARWIFEGSNFVTVGQISKKC